MTIKSGGDKGDAVAFAHFPFNVVVAGEGLDQKQTALDEIFVVVVFHEDVVDELETAAFDHLLTVLVAYCQTGQCGKQLFDDRLFFTENYETLTLCFIKINLREDEHFVSPVKRDDRISRPFSLSAIMQAYS